MADKQSAIYGYGLDWVRFFALNDDNTLPSNDNIVGGKGPFNFGGVDTIGAVPITVKIDDADAITVEVDLTAAAIQTAVTVAEIVTALTTAFAAEDPAVEITAEDHATSGRLVLADDNAATGLVLQVYGELAELCMIGQGFGVKYLKSDTVRSMTETAVRKAGETIATTDAWGVDTTVVTDGYYKGFTAPVVDTAEDWEIFALCEGLIINESGGISSPTAETKRPMIGIELFYRKYLQGENRESELVGYRQVVYPYCKGLGGDATHERAFADSTYNLEGMTHRDATTKVLMPAWIRYELSVNEFNALKVDSI